MFLFPVSKTNRGPKLAFMLKILVFNVFSSDEPGLFYSKNAIQAHA
jgi:hypothetical protein